MKKIISFIILYPVIVLSLFFGTSAIAESGKEYHIQTGIVKDTCFLVVDDKLVLVYVDNNPINDPQCNRVGLGIYCSKIAFRRFRLYQAVVHPVSREYVAEF